MLQWQVFFRAIEIMALVSEVAIRVDSSGLKPTFSRALIRTILNHTTSRVLVDPIDIY